MIFSSFSDVSVNSVVSIWHLVVCDVLDLRNNAGQNIFIFLTNRDPPMLSIKEIFFDDYENGLEVNNPRVGLHAFIAIHSTILGPALGGTRIYPYRKREDALDDVLRLARAMTYKSALAENGFGGGKSVIIADPKTQKNEALLLAFGEVINLLKGSYIAAEDVGSTEDDMSIIRRKTPYVAGLPTERSSGDPSRFTAWGLFRGLQAVAQKLWNTPSLEKKVIAIQGLGHVGSGIANLLFGEGADLILTDLDRDQSDALAMKTGARVIEPDDYFNVPCDILAPCAIGGILNADTIPRLACRAVAGSANNQLFEEHDGQRLKERGILYAPDYVINAGGLMNVSAEFEQGGYDPRRSRDNVNRIYETLLEIFNRAEKEDKPTNFIANDLGEYKLQHKIAKRETPLNFHPVAGDGINRQECLSLT